MRWHAGARSSNVAKRETAATISKACLSVRNTPTAALISRRVVDRNARAARNRSQKLNPSRCTAAYEARHRRHVNRRAVMQCRIMLRHSWRNVAYARNRRRNLAREYANVMAASAAHRRPRGKKRYRCRLDE